jgi:hypothetical protein
MEMIYSHEVKKYESSRIFHSGMTPVFSFIEPGLPQGSALFKAPNRHLVESFL